MYTQKKPIKIGFSDAWTNDPDFYKNWSFYKIIQRNFQIEISDQPDVLFYFPYGKKHFSYDCHKIQVSGENERPTFWCADFSITFDYNNDYRHLRYPNYVDWFTPEYNLEKLLVPRTADDAKTIRNSKKKFCCFVVSNPVCKERNDFFYKLSTYKQVDSGGGYLNNIGGRVEDKHAFVKDYKFVIAFENSSYPGYTTEKVLEGKLVDSVPIYWGNPIIHKEMNPKAFINYNEYSGFEALMQKIIEVDNNDELYEQYLREPLFYNHQPNEYFDEQRVVLFFKKVVNQLAKPSISSRSLYFKSYRAKLLASQAVNGFARQLYHRIKRV